MVNSNHTKTSGLRFILHDGFIPDDEENLPSFNTYDSLMNIMDVHRLWQTWESSNLSHQLSTSAAGFLHVWFIATCMLNLHVW